MEAGKRIESTPFQGVYKNHSGLYTKNLVPGIRVYGERLVPQQGSEFREWTHTRSKLAAYLRLGGSFLPMNERSNVLYLGAASGTTASHVSDIAASGTVYCVEVSSRSFRDLLMVCDLRENMVPLLADAAQPSSFGFAVGVVDVVYQDVAQRDQVSIFTRNMDHFRSSHGMLALKSRSEDVSLPPRKVYERGERELRRKGFKVVEVLPLDPYEKDHAMMVVERR